MGKQFKRSSNSVVAGVAAGVAEYFGIDPTIVRILWALLIIVGGTGLLLYLICWLFMPKA